MAKKKPITWTNERRKLSDLIPWEKNPRTIKNAQAERLVDSVETFGQVETLAVDCSNNILNGHQRLSVLAGQYGMDYEVDVRVASRELTERERQQLTVYLHKGAAGEWSFPDLLTWDHDDLITWGFDAEELNISFDEEPTTAGADTEPQVSKADELKQQWGTELGQMWRLGDHRLICGDCTDAATVARLMGNDMMDCVTTDPPYGVDYDGGTTKREKLAGDDTPALYFPALNLWKKYCQPHVALYLWYADGDMEIAQAVAQAGWQVRRNLIWNKNLAQYGALSQQYKQKHEPFLYCHLKGKSPYWAGDGTEVTVWDIDRHSVNDLHPTQKPPALFERAMKNSSKAGNIVFDGFGGSGVTIIAAENLGRIARVSELNAGYVAVILDRFHRHTGIQPELID